MWAIPTGTSLALKKKSGKESQFGGSDRESGCDNSAVGSICSKERDQARVKS